MLYTVVQVVFVTFHPFFHFGGVAQRVGNPVAEFKLAPRLPIPNARSITRRPMFDPVNSQSGERTRTDAAAVRRQSAVRQGSLRNNEYENRLLEGTKQNPLVTEGWLSIGGAKEGTQSR